ncbi:hypothetical protein F4861DRAFT_491887 [Xylaria intraflava]|nr:hypothetical protein F4861DRAFT_491887 [Xylaria intraflava]
MSSNTIKDLKTTIKGIQGASEALRGEALATLDRALDPDPNDPQTRAAAEKNQAIADQGKRDMQALRDRLAGQKGQPDEVEGVKESQPQSQPQSQPGPRSGNVSGAGKGPYRHPHPLP